jgi:hypothetical protein
MQPSAAKAFLPRYRFSRRILDFVLFFILFSLRYRGRIGLVGLDARVADGGVSKLMQGVIYFKISFKLISRMLACE